VTVEFFRFGANETGELSAGAHYLLATASRPVRDIALSEIFDARKLPLKPLRYGTDDAARRDAVEKLGTAIRELLGPDWLDSIGEPAALHLDLVTNPAELAMLPFELVKDGRGAPLVVGDRSIELTRSVRTESSQVDAPWAAEPRVLFVCASPERGVPFDAHLAALRKALDPWVPAFEGVNEPAALGRVLTVLERATLPDIEEACRKAKTEGRPFTHVHVLAHGTSVDRGEKRRFGLALHDVRDPATLYGAYPEELVRALEPLRREPVVVTLAACDSANEANSAIPEKSVAHELHVFGFPVVLASQLPLTVPGSTVLVSTFYTGLLQGRDVRDALHASRLALFADGGASRHDWASLTAYVRLPERYEDHLAEVRLRSALLSLEVTRKLSERLSNEPSVAGALVDEVERRLKADLERLDRYRSDPLTARTPDLVQEAHGLLGSAEKRLAEHYHSRGRDLAAASKQALERSRDWYRRGHLAHLSDHWLGTQSLGLEAVLLGRVDATARWYATLTAAEAAVENPDEYWALGSLAELWLIASKVVGIDASPALDNALRHLRAMGERAARVSKDAFPLDSTRRQLERYVHWWTRENGYFAASADLSDAARSLLTAVGPSGKPTGPGN
jgi:hypothetical protein